MKRIPKPLAFDWDKGNVDKSFNKHNVTSKEAEETFSNKPLKIFEDLSHSEKEQRFMAFGVTNLSRKLTVVFTLRKQKIRVISARDQNIKERRVYEKTSV